MNCWWFLSFAAFAAVQAQHDTVPNMRVTPLQAQTENNGLLKLLLGEDKNNWCIKKGKGRGLGSAAEVVCKKDEEQNGLLCYPKCKEGYESVGCCICRKKGCGNLAGAVDMGVSCAKPKAYGRGAGYVSEARCVASNSQGCEKNLLLWYPKCRAGFHAFGCCVCTPDCPDGYTDDGAFCRKDSYGRGAGEYRGVCPKGEELNGLMCYPPCPTGYSGVGPMCWGQCGKNPKATTECGLFCAASTKVCVNYTAKMVAAGGKAFAKLLKEDYWGAAMIVKDMFDVPQC